MHLLIGTIFEKRYEILQLLGSGGMGSVYKARQLDADRIVALKILHPQDAHESAESIKRFQREAKVLAKLQHKNIVTFYHFGLAESRLPYTVIEFIAGQSLNNILEQHKRLSELRTLKITKQVCEALSYSHKLGVVHRDLKPNNIILVSAPEEDTVKIIDFGLAKLLVSEGPLDAKLTKTGLLVGSPHYMSPEQIRGKATDERSDIYSCGCMLFEMLCGEKPFMADNSIGILYKQCNEPLPELSNLDTNLSKEIELICRKATEKDPASRYQSTHDMLIALNSVMGVSSTPLNTSETNTQDSHYFSDSRHYASKSIRPWTLMGILLLAYTIGAVITATYLRHHQHHSDSGATRKSIIKITRVTVEELSLSYPRDWRLRKNLQSGVLILLEIPGSKQWAGVTALKYTAKSIEEAITGNNNYWRKGNATTKVIAKNTLNLEKLGRATEVLVQQAKVSGEYSFKQFIGMNDSSSKDAAILPIECCKRCVYFQRAEHVYCVILDCPKDELKKYEHDFNNLINSVELTFPPINRHSDD